MISKDAIEYLEKKKTKCDLKDAIRYVSEQLFLRPLCSKRRRRAVHPSWPLWSNHDHIRIHDNLKWGGEGGGDDLKKHWVYCTDMMHDDKDCCLNVHLTAKMQFYHLALIESGIINVSLSDQHFQSIRFEHFFDLIHFAHETWLHQELQCQKIFPSNRLQWDCLQIFPFLVEIFVNTMIAMRLPGTLTN